MSPRLLSVCVNIDSVKSLRLTKRSRTEFIMSWGNCSKALITVVICWVSLNLADIRYWKTLLLLVTSRNTIYKNIILSDVSLITSCWNWAVVKVSRVSTLSVSPYPPPYCPRSQIIFILHNLPNCSPHYPSCDSPRGLWLVRSGQHWPLIGWQPQSLSSHIVRCQLGIFWWPVTW